MALTKGHFGHQGENGQVLKHPLHPLRCIFLSAMCNSTRFISIQSCVHFCQRSCIDDRKVKPVIWFVFVLTAANMCFIYLFVHSLNRKNKIYWLINTNIKTLMASFYWLSHYYGTKLILFETEQSVLNIWFEKHFRCVCSVREVQV